MISSGSKPASSASSAIGTISGGSEMMRGSPSTTCVNLANAFMLSFVRAFATPRSIALACFLSFWARRFATMSVASSLEYQTPRLFIAANSRIASRYARTAVKTADRRTRSSKPRSLPAISKLAASRLTSHSNGPGSVSSKSLRSKTRSRDGEAKPPKLERWASPQSCALRPARGVPARSCAMRLAAPR